MNKQITEDYVSYEIAKLLKEKGFDELCNYEWWIPNIDKGYVLIANGQIKNSDLLDEAYTAPTHQMTLKWLREVHKLFVNLDLGIANGDKGVLWSIVRYNNNDIEFLSDYTFEDSYEQSVEAALKYTLENLI